MLSRTTFGNLFFQGPLGDLSCFQGPFGIIMLSRTTWGLMFSRTIWETYHAFKDHLGYHVFKDHLGTYHAFNDHLETYDIFIKLMKKIWIDTSKELNIYEFVLLLLGSLYAALIIGTAIL